MAYPNSWTLEDILTANFLPSTKSSKLRFAFEEFDSLNEFLQSNQSGKYEFKLSAPELIPDSKKEIIIKAKDEAKSQIELCEKNKVQICSYWDDTYPSLLREIDYPPIILYIKGRLQAADAVSISIVGTRQSTSYGTLCVEQFANFIAKLNIIITSGLADGIDTICHLVAMKSGGTTYAVIASGIDKISPQLSNRNAEKIVDKGGAIISEYPCGVPAFIWNFPVRNRIISGISKATIIIECAEKSGALITARFAFEQGREVFAIPGNLNNEKSKGTNKLIKDNIATVALSPEQVCRDLGLIKDESKLDFYEKQKQTLTKEENKVLNLMDSEPIQIDEMASKLDMEIPELLVLLLNMEFNNLVKQLPGKYYIKC
ncbi:MAG: DNA-processing protein DprA [FCB group bacterium]|jgi:DNA processing protein